MTFQSGAWTSWPEETCDDLLWQVLIYFKLGSEDNLFLTGLIVQS
ncbi:hypothetical protein THOE12_20646 [Vibrio rotiferianus]|nr:hypothetical protein THOE12_20646 [Vibrio rotiferianus]